MGASVSRDASKTTQQTIEECVDYGTTLPNGIYSATQQDFNLRIVRNLIVERKLAPFYKGLSDLPEQSSEPISIPSPPPTTSTTSTSKVRSRSASTSYGNHGTTIQEQDIKKALYKDAVECPICFLYYPANINHARCCDQPVCTECFLQIKRPVDTPSSPATCPFCMVDHFGVVYKPPTWKDSRSNNSPGRSKVSPTTQARSNASTATATATAAIEGAELPRRKNISHNSPDVVLVDHVRPDWKNPKATDSSSSSSPVPPRRNSDGRPAFFRNRRGILTRPNRSQSAATPLHHTTTQSNHPPHQQQRTSYYGMDFDIEEYMIMEAIRLSLQDQEAARTRNAADGNTDEANGVTLSEDNPVTTGTVTPTSDANNNNNDNSTR